MSIAYQQLAALCRLASYGIDSISDTAPAESEMTFKELKALAISRNEFNCYDEGESERAHTILEIVWAIGKRIKVNDTPFVRLWLALDMPEYK